MKNAVRQTLKRIRQRSPADFKDLQSLVRQIAPLSEHQIKDGTQGRWEAEQPKEDDPRTWGYGLDRTPGKLFLSEHFETREDAIACIAHEFGHVCTRFEDLERRGGRFNPEWTSELAADWYACKKWGFGKEIARSRKNRHFLHHGPKPGDVFQFGDGHYQVTRNFCIRPRE